MAKESGTNATVIKDSMNLWSEMELQISVLNARKTVILRGEWTPRGMKMTWRSISWQCGLWPLHSYNFMLYQGNVPDSLRAYKVARLGQGRGGVQVVRRGWKEQVEWVDKGRERKRREVLDSTATQRYVSHWQEKWRICKKHSNSLKNDHFSQLAGIMLQTKGKRT